MSGTAFHYPGQASMGIRRSSFIKLLKTILVFPDRFPVSLFSFIPSPLKSLAECFQIASPLARAAVKCQEVSEALVFSFVLTGISDYGRYASNLREDRRGRDEGIRRAGAGSVSGLEGGRAAPCRQSIGNRHSWSTGKQC